ALYSGSIAMVAAVLASFGYILVLSGRFKFFSAFAAVFVGAAILFFIAAPSAQTKVDAVVAARPAEESFFETNARREKDRALWKMTLDLLMERPFLGYGYGPDRFRSAAASAGYLNGVDRSGETYAFFDRGYLRASGSHNGFIESLFAVGLAGTLAYVFFWLTVARKTKGIFLTISSKQGAVFLRLGVTGFMLSALALSMTESILGGPSGAVLTAVAAAGAVLFKEFDALPKNYRTVWVFDRQSN
ncbi:MAG: O-antigen ligase family protein, partial [Nitrospirota bacterium]|nr:O-antigen ligase family protein [Nitrospirota bacterium]